MREPNRVWAGLYGAAFHALLVVIMVGLALYNRAELVPAVLVRAVPVLLVSALVLYYFIVGPYLPSRSKRKAAVFADSAIGMLVETAIAVLTSVLYSLIASIPTLSDGFGAFGPTFLWTSARTLLWMFGSFFVQILVVGNAAGLVGWVVLKKLADRSAATSPKPDAA